MLTRSLCICKSSVVKVKLSSSLTSTKGLLRKGFFFFSLQSFQNVSTGWKPRTLPVTDCSTLPNSLQTTQASLLVPRQVPSVLPSHFSTRLVCVSQGAPDTSLQESQTFDLRSSSFSCAFS